MPHPQDVDQRSVAVASGLSTKVAYNNATAFLANGGDSISLGVGSTTPATDGYLPHLVIDRGLTSNVIAVSGDQAADQLKLINALTVADGSYSTLNIGLNDTRQYGASAAKQDAFQKAHLACLAWLAIPNAFKLKGQSSSITYSGTWANDTANGNIGKSIAPSTAGTATATVYGTTVYLATILNGTGTASFSVTIDGAAKGSFSCIPAATITTQNGQTYSGYLLRFPGLTEANHTVVMTVPGTNSGTVFLDWMGGNLGASNKDGPNVFVGNIYRMNATGYATAPANSSDALIAFANQQIRENVNLLAADGLNVVLVDTCSRFNTSTHLNADGIHPNNAGHLVIEAAFLDAMNQISHVRTRAGRPLPDGGSTGQVLTKLSANDGDTSWQTPSSSGATLGPVFHVHNTSNQSVATSAFTKVTFNTVDFDPSGAWNATNFRWIPQTAGYYLFNATIGGPSTGVDTVAIYKNGVIWTRGNLNAAAAGTVNAHISDIVSANGTTDYFEIFYYSSTGSVTHDAGTTCFFSGARVG